MKAIQRGINVVGPTRDALYLWTGGQLQFYPPMPSLLTGQAEKPPKTFTLADDPNEFVIVYGVNHEAYGKAALSLFVVYGADIWNGVGGVGSDQYPGQLKSTFPATPTPSTFTPTRSGDDVTARTVTGFRVLA